METAEYRTVILVHVMIPDSISPTNVFIYIHMSILLKRVGIYTFGKRGLFCVTVYCFLLS